MSTPKRSRDGAVVADRLTHELEHLARHAGAVLERSSVLVGAVVEERKQELVQQRLRVRAVDDEDVEAGAASPLAGVDVVLLHLADVLPIHLLAGAHEREGASDLRGAARGHPALLAAGVGAPVPDLDRRERAVLVEHVAHQAQVPDVAVVPEPRADPVRVVALRGDRAVLGAHGAPAALRLHGPEVGLKARPVRAGAVAMRHLEEPVGQRLRADLDRLEEDVVLRIAGHVRPPLSSLPPFLPARRHFATTPAALTSSVTGRVGESSRRCTRARS